jgi:hypothetical protein
MISQLSNTFSTLSINTNESPSTSPVGTPTTKTPSSDFEYDLNWSWGDGPMMEFSPDPSPKAAAAVVNSHSFEEEVVKRPKLEVCEQAVPLPGVIAAPPFSVPFPLENLSFY